MWSFNGLRPHKLEEQGDQYVSEAQRLLNNHGAELSPSRRQPAEDLLSEASDYKGTLRETRLLKRILVAKLYAERARKALQKIEDWLGPQAVTADLGPLVRPTYSR